jgi:chromosome condensin MukBEF complex kleisin-like MukF subunit
MYSKAHNAYKVGHCPHDYLGERFKQIRKTVPDVVVHGTAVFTSRQNAFDAEQKVLNDNRQYQYRGIHGDHSGGSEWLTRRPSSKKPSFMSPKKVEERYQKQVNAPLQPIEIPDKYTVYLAYSKIKNAYKVKWCNSENLPKKIANLQSEAADTIIVSRFKVETKGKAREITKMLNAAAGAFQTSGRDDIVKWVNNPSYLKEFKPWDKDGKRIIT